MELLDRYLQAVRFWLPKAQQEDIIAELSSDLHSQIDDRESELGRPLDKAELEVILRKCGSPILVASRYRPQTQLIGPALFPIYQFVLKVTLLWILVPVFLLIVGPAIVLPAADRWAALFKTWSTLSTALFASAGIITLVFAVLERTQAQFGIFEKWNPSSLPPVPKKRQPPKRSQSIFEMILASIGLVWLLATPHYPFLVLGPAAAYLKPAPLWHNYYWPLIVLAALGLAHQCVAVLRPQWTWFPASARLITNGMSLTVLYFILSAAFRPAIGAWQPFVVADATMNLPHYARLVAVANLCIGLALAGTWIGLAITQVVQTWECLKQISCKDGLGRRPPLLRFL